MTWLDTDFIGCVNTKNAVGIQIQVKGNEYQVFLEKMSMHSPNNLHLIFRGHKDKFGALMRRLKSRLPNTWVDNVDGVGMSNIENAIAIQINSQGVVDLEFETNTNRAPLRTIFHGDASKSASFIRKLKLPESWVPTIEGNFINTDNAIGVRSSTQGDWHEVQVVVDVPREQKPIRTVFRSESESDCKAFLEDLTAVLKKGAAA